MDRRAFLTLGTAGALGWLHGTRNADAQDPAQIDIPYGETRLALSDDVLQGTVYVPKSYKHGAPMPLLVMLHGFNGTAQSVRNTFPLAEEFGVIVIAPESRVLTWGKDAPGFDDDGHYIAEAVRAVGGFLDVDPAHVALGGVSDGATYALAMGLAYGKVFNHLIGLSEGIIKPFLKEGKPRVFIAHGVNDVQMPIDRTSRKFVPDLKAEGYDVTYREYEGGHGVPSAFVREAFQWFLAKPARPR